STDLRTASGATRTSQLSSTLCEPIFGVAPTALASYPHSSPPLRFASGWADLWPSGPMALQFSFQTRTICPQARLLADVREGVHARLHTSFPRPETNMTIPTDVVATTPEAVRIHIFSRICATIFLEALPCERSF